jgi:hypothetical protein
VSVERPTDTRCSYPRAAAMSTGADLAARCVWARSHDARAAPGRVIRGIGIWGGGRHRG